MVGRTTRWTAGFSRKSAEQGHRHGKFAIVAGIFLLSATNFRRNAVSTEEFYCGQPPRDKGHSGGHGVRIRRQRATSKHKGAEHAWTEQMCFSVTRSARPPRRIERPMTAKMAAVIIRKPYSSRQGGRAKLAGGSASAHEKGPPIRCARIGGPHFATEHQAASCGVRPQRRKPFTAPRSRRSAARRRYWPPGGGRTCVRPS